MVFTIGLAETYDERLQLYGSDYYKYGRKNDYAGGYATKTIADAMRLIAELEKTGWAVYRLDANWYDDTYKQSGEWFHRLLRDSQIIGKVENLENAGE